VKVSQFILMAAFAGIFFVVGVGVLWWGIQDSRSAFKSVRWPSVNGTVISSYVSESSDDDGTTYGADVQYDYVVNDQAHTGDRVSHGDVSTGDPSYAQKIVARYSEGQSVNVYYDPTDPAKSVLETGFTPGLLLPLGLGTVFTLVGGLMLIGFTATFIRSRNQTG
jgi:hypothetical protein